MKPSVKINNLYHNFTNNGTGLEVLNNISMEVHQHEIVAIVGPSGCGKSTLLKLISGLLSPTSGKIMIMGIKPTQARDRKLIGFAFQEAVLLPWLSVFDNIQLPKKIGRKKNNNYQDPDWLLDLVGLKNFKGFKPHQLSGGMKQRVALARALFTNPDLLVLDEPFSSLDILTRSKLIVEFYRILKKTDTTTILVTHNIEEAIFIADRVVMLSGRPASILKEHNIDFKANRDLSLFENQDFIEEVSDFKNILLKQI